MGVVMMVEVTVRGDGDGMPDQDLVTVLHADGDDGARGGDCGGGDGIWGHTHTHTQTHPNATPTQTHTHLNATTDLVRPRTS